MKSLCAAACNIQRRQQQSFSLYQIKALREFWHFWTDFSTNAVCEILRRGMAAPYLRHIPPKFRQEKFELKQQRQRNILHNPGDYESRPTSKCAFYEAIPKWALKVLKLQLHLSEGILNFSWCTSSNVRWPLRCYNSTSVIWWRALNTDRWWRRDSRCDSAENVERSFDTQAEMMNLEFQDCFALATFDWFPLSAREGKRVTSCMSRCVCVSCQNYPEWSQQYYLSTKT